MVSSIAFVPGSSAIQIATTGVDTNPCFADHLKLQFYNWYGSHKFKVYITASIYHSVRLVFYLAVNAASDWQVCYHKVVEIQGSTEVEMMIPYCPQSVAIPGVSAVTPYSVYCAILSWSQSDLTISNPIYLNTYKAAASDFKVGCPKDVRYVLQSSPREEFNRDFDPLHPSLLGYGQDNLVFGEDIKTLRNMMHKMSPHRALAAATTALILTNRTVGTNLVGIDMYAAFYRFWAGSVKYKFLSLKSALKYKLITVRLGSGPLFHGLGVGAPDLNSCEGEIPYYSPSLFDNCGTTAMYDRNMYSLGTETAFQFMGAGDDFSFHWMIIPPPGVYTDNFGSGFGYYGVTNFYA